MPAQIIDALCADIPGLENNFDLIPVNARRDEAVADRVRTLDQHGIALQFLCPAAHGIERCWTDSLTRGSYDAHIRAVLEKGNGRLRALSLANFDDGTDGLQSLKAAANDGFAGVAMLTRHQNRRIDDQRYFAFFQAASDAQLPVFLFSTGLYEGGPPVSARQQSNVAAAGDIAIAAARLIFSGHLEKLPLLKICLSESGGVAPQLISRWNHGYQVRPECRRLIPNPPSEYFKKIYINDSDIDPETYRSVTNIVSNSKIVFASGQRGLRAAVSQLGAIPPGESGGVESANAKVLFSMKD